MEKSKVQQEGNEKNNIDKVEGGASFRMHFVTNIEGKSINIQL